MNEMAGNYLVGEVTLQEAAMVLDWFLTPEGEDYLVMHIDQVFEQPLSTAAFGCLPDQQELFRRIQEKLGLSTVP